MRVDTAHDGGRKGEKGTRVIATVYGVTQFQEFAVSLITEYFMVPVLEALVGASPFRVLKLLADNGSVRIDQRVAAMLDKLHIEELDKSPPRGRSAPRASAPGSPGPRGFPGRMPD